jgi:predicted transcriptional regulator
MPRWASRILLEVVSIRVERVQEIDINGIIAEGIHESYVATVESGIINPPLHAFRKLWDSINEKRGYSWEVNPWVWVVEFKRIDEEIAYDR